MRTCPNCGCYVPDRWITCPACEVRVKPSKEALAPHNTTSKVFPNGVYRVKVFYDPYGMDELIFGLNENAFSYAKHTATARFVKTVEVWDCQTKECLAIFC